MRKMAGLDFRSREMFHERAWAVTSEEEDLDSRREFFPVFILR